MLSDAIIWVTLEDTVLDETKTAPKGKWCTILHMK